MKVANKVFIVTGGGNGIGRELTLQLLARGARVAALDMNAAGLEETARLAGENKAGLSTHRADITDRALIEKLPGEILARHGAIDGLINNAGIIQPFVKLVDTDYGIIEKVMNVNFFGTLNMVKAFLPHLLKRPEAHLVNLSSMGGFFPVSGQAIYGASKAAVKLLTEGLRAELKGTKVRVSVVFPGGVSSNIVQNSGAEMTPQMQKLQKTIKLQTPHKAARAIIRGIERNRYRMFVGIDSKLMNLIYKLSPKTAVGWIDSFTSSIVMNKR